jgi:DNA-binding transcriptional regulator YiaG
MIPDERPVPAPNWSAVIRSAASRASAPDTDTISEDEEVDQPSEPSVCVECGQPGIRRELGVEAFEYRTPTNDVVQLEAAVDVYRCPSCGAAFTTAASEAARHAALCRYLRRPSPSDIAALREQHKKTRAQFALDTGIGEASMARWERGQQIVSASMAGYLALLADQANYERARLAVSGLAQNSLDTATSEMRVPNRRISRSNVAGFDLEAARRRGRGFHPLRRV